MNPASTINQFAQTGRIRGMVTDAQEVKARGHSYWTVTVSCVADGVELDATCGGGSKKEARSRAFESILMAMTSPLQLGQLAPPSPPPSRSPSPSTSFSTQRSASGTSTSTDISSAHSSSPPAATTILTKKQARVLEEAQEQLDLAHRMYQEAVNRPVILVSIDVERAEDREGRHHITECAIAADNATTLHHPTTTPPLAMRQHLIVTEVQHLHCPYVKNNRYGFAHGQSTAIPAESLAAEIQGTITKLGQVGEVVITGHSVAGDLRWLKEIGCDLSAYKYIDVAQCFQSITTSINRAKLEHIAHHFGLLPPIDSAPYYHNAGNDAVAALECCRALMERGGWGAFSDDGPLL